MWHLCMYMYGVPNTDTYQGVPKVIRTQLSLVQFGQPTLGRSFGDRLEIHLYLPFFFFLGVIVFSTSTSISTNTSTTVHASFPYHSLKIVYYRKRAWLQSRVVPNCRIYRRRLKRRRFVEPPCSLYVYLVNTV